MIKYSFEQKNPKAKPAENKLERPVKERKGTTSKKTEKEQKEGEGE